MWIQFLALANWGTNFGLYEIGENKNKKAELEKEMERTTPQSWEIDKLRMIHPKKYNSLIRTLGFTQEPRETLS